MLCTRLWCIPCRHCAGLLVLLLGFRIRVRGYQNFARAEKLGAVSAVLLPPAEQLLGVAVFETVVWQLSEWMGPCE